MTCDGYVVVVQGCRYLHFPSLLCGFPLWIRDLHQLPAVLPSNVVFLILLKCLLSCCWFCNLWKNMFWFCLIGWIACPFNCCRNRSCLRCAALCTLTFCSFPLNHNVKTVTQEHCKWKQHWKQQHNATYATHTTCQSVPCAIRGVR